MGRGKRALEKGKGMRKLGKGVVLTYRGPHHTTGGGQRQALMSENRKGGGRGGWLTCCGGKYHRPRQVGVDEHEGVVGAPVAAAGVGVQYVQLPPQIVLVLLPAVISLQPA